MGVCYFYETRKELWKKMHSVGQGVGMRWKRTKQPEGILFGYNSPKSGTSHIDASCRPQMGAQRASDALHLNVLIGRNTRVDRSTVAVGRVPTGSYSVE